ncbi:MAG: WD40/YVTN/BNR-like repeat-containing protein [Methylophagaceae bacterium]
MSQLLLQLIYAGTGEAFGSAQRGSGIYKSTDTGRTWSSLASTEPSSSDDFTYVARIVVSSDGSIYAACKSAIYCNAGGLMKSTNSGTSWSRVVGTYSAGGCSNADDFKGTEVEENDPGDLF